MSRRPPLRQPPPNTTASGIARQYRGDYKEDASCAQYDPCPIGKTLYERPNPVAKRVHFDADYAAGNATFEVRLPTQVKLRALAVEQLLFNVRAPPSGNFLWLQINSGESNWNGDWYDTVAVSTDTAPAAVVGPVSMDKIPITAAANAVQVYEPRRPMIREWTGPGRPHTLTLKIRLADRFGADYQVGADAGPGDTRLVGTLVFYCEEH